MTNDQAKAQLKEIQDIYDPGHRKHTALDIALWWAEQQKLVAAMLTVLASSKRMDRARMQDWQHDVIEAACAVETWVKEHPRPGSEGT